MGRWIQNGQPVGVSDWIDDVGRAANTGADILGAAGSAVDLFNGTDDPNPVSTYQRYVPDNDTVYGPPVPAPTIDYGGSVSINSGQKGGIPWWVFVIGGAVVIGGVYYMTK